jgi:hypothetical protein
METRVQEALLQDPCIRDAVKKAGQDALADPAVQRQILDVCVQKFPEAASVARQQIVEWANDPDVQRKACEYAGVARLYAGHAVGYAGQAAGQAGEQLVRLIEQGPTGVRILAFFGGVGSCVNSCVTLHNPLTAVLGPVSYVVAVYQVIFAITTILFEARPEWIEQVPGLNWYQDVIIDQAKFLTEAGGRGMFYGFQGSLWLACASFAQAQNFVIGLYFVFLSGLHISMHYGVMPQHIAQKIRQGGYTPVPLSLDDLPPDFVQAPFAAAQPGKDIAQRGSSREISTVAQDSVLLASEAPADTTTVSLLPESIEQEIKNAKVSVASEVPSYALYKSEEGSESKAFYSSALKGSPNAMMSSTKSLSRVSIDIGANQVKEYVVDSARDVRVSEQGLNAPNAKDKNKCCVVM